MKSYLDITVYKACYGIFN